MLLLLLLLLLLLTALTLLRVALCPSRSQLCWPSLRRELDARTRWPRWC